MNNQKVEKRTIIRTIVNMVAMVNLGLTISGKNPLPYSESEIYTGLSVVAEVCTNLWTWWKNNSFTKAAIRADGFLKQIKNGVRNG